MPTASENKTTDENAICEVDFHRFRPEMYTKVLIQRGLIKDFSASFLPSSSRNAPNFLISDSIVGPLYADTLLKRLKQEDVQVTYIEVPTDEMDETGESSSERFKTMDVYMKCVNKVMDSGLNKHSCIISLGGGVINNICGFLAATIYRGISLVHVTTTLMGQADAAIDFKQAVNHPCGKNLLGAYYPASTVVCDPVALTTLSRRHLLNGLSECLKHALCQSSEFLDYMVDNVDQLQHVDYLETVVRDAVEMKAPTLTHYNKSDFNEMCPQYGHAVGHAVEHLSWNTSEPLLHGEACAVGMCVSAEVSFLLGYCNRATVDRHYEVFETVGLPVFVPVELATEAILDKMCFDKHFVAKKPTMGLVREIGEMVRTEDGNYSHSIEIKVLEKALEINREKRD